MQRRLAAAQVELGPKGIGELLGVLASVLVVSVLFITVVGMFQGRALALLTGGLVAAVALASLTFFRWEWVLLVGVVALPLESLRLPVFVGQTQVGLWDACVFAALLGWAVSGRRTPAVRSEPTRASQMDTMGLAVVMTGGVFAASTVIGRVQRGEQALNIGSIEIVVWYFVARAMCANAGARRGVLAAIVLSGAVQGAYGTLQHWGVLSHPMNYDVQPRGFLHWLFRFGPVMVDPGCGSLPNFTALGHYLSQCFPSAALLSFSLPKGMARTAARVAMVLIVSGLITSYARGSLLCAVIAMIAALLLLSRGEAAVRARGAGLALAALAILLVFAAISTEYKTTLNLTSRQSIWREQLADFPASGWDLMVGRGLGYSRDVVRIGAHSTYVMALVDTGLMGCAALATLIGAGLLSPVFALRGPKVGERELASFVGFAAALTFAIDGLVESYWSGYSFAMSQLVLLAALGAGARLETPSGEADAGSGRATSRPRRPPRARPARPGADAGAAGAASPD